MNNSKKSQKVFVALSGGVDSAVSAAILVQEGYDVTGVYMKNWSGDDFGVQDECPWEEDQSGAEAVCRHLGIPFRSFNFERQYRDKVVEYFFDEYKAGRTPNPDVMCNKEIKFKLFLDKAIEEGADLIATGHYARNNRNELGEFQLLKGVDENKNQVYFLYNITQEQLAKTVFPIGNMTKGEVRAKAHEFGLPNADKPDSQGICFIGEINVLKFLMSRIPQKTGDIVDIESGKKVGKHEGIYFYTLGQRAKIAGEPEPYFFCAKDINQNIMFVCHGHDNPKLFKKAVEIESLHLISEKHSPISDNENLTAMVRYRQEPQSGILEISSKDLNKTAIKFQFDLSQRAVTSGQSLVLFDGDICLGGGVIK